MAQLTTRHDQFLTYLLSDPEQQASLELVPERGGIITRWQLQGRDLLYLDAERFANPELSVRGGIPILFPICGNLPDNTYTYRGQPYTLKQHGFGRDLPWQVVEQLPADRPSITLELSSNEQTRTRYPFEFRLRFRYQLVGNRLELHQECTNLSSEPLPVSFGFHPYFPVSDKSQLEFDIPATEYLDHRSLAGHFFAGTFDFSQTEIDVAFRELSRQTATVTDRAAKTRITLNYSPEFSTLVFWTVQGKDFYCLEPWTAGRNAINTGDRLLTIAPHSSLETSFSLTAEFLS